MNKFFGKLGLLMICGVLLYACKSGNTHGSGEKPDPSRFDGKSISRIKSNIIYLGDGDSIRLEEDSIQKIFYLTRHAEKDTSIKGDPPLTAEGFARATKIADILRGTRVDVIYSTMTLRALYTVDSLAEIKQMSVLPYDNKSLKPTIDSIKTSTEFNRIFLVGHSNTIPSITNSLADKDIYTSIFDEGDYGNFIVVVCKKSGKSDVYKLRY
jgi:phosphohistidine phosphatase SixA